MEYNFKDKPLVSVVIPCYNHEKYIKECIESVISQDYYNIELIIIDDGSKDRSVEKIKEMIPACKKRFRRFEFRSRTNKGLCATLNEAIEWIKGKYFSCVASDDILLPDKTSYQVTYLDENILTLGVFGGVEVFDELIGKRQRVINRTKKYNFNDILMHNHNLPAPTQMLRVDSVMSVGGYREEFIIEDWSMWLFMTEKGGTLDYISKTFAVYRRHQENISGKLELMNKGRDQILKVFENDSNYNEACAMAKLVAANETRLVDRRKSIKIAFSSIKNYPFIALKKPFISFLVKIILNK